MIDFEELHVFDNSLSKYVPREMLEQAEALAASRLELLRRWNNQTYKCVFCNGWLTWTGETEPERTGHALDCELAKALVSEQSEEELGDE